MINTLLTSITSVISKDYLFCSFLPSLIFHALLIATMAWVVGLEAAFSWLDSLSASLKAALAACVSVEIIVVAYVLNGLRGAILAFWSGTTRSWWTWGFRRLGEEVQGRRFRQLRKEAGQLSTWNEIFEAFRQKVAGPYGKGQSQLDDRHRSSLLRRAEAACTARTSEKAKFELDDIASEYRVYRGDDLAEVYKTVKQALDDRHREESIGFQSKAARLDRYFGNLQTIRATSLGNVIASYNLYPWKRYAMEAEVFWPRLRKVLPTEYAPFVQEQQILLDFALTMATLSGVYSLFALIAGPWLWYQPFFWLPLAGAAVACSLFFYRLALQTAVRFGDLVRSSFDLFRLDLMKELRRPHPATLEAERQQWREMSELVVYGQAPDFALIEKK